MTHAIKIKTALQDARQNIPKPVAIWGGWTFNVYNPDGTHTQVRRADYAEALWARKVTLFRHAMAVLDGPDIWPSEDWRAAPLEKMVRVYLNAKERKHP